MKLAELKAQHPEVYAEAIAEGKAQGIADGEKAGYEKGHKAGLEAGADQENARIKSIEGVNQPGAEKIVSDNKFDRSMTAEKVAFLIVTDTKKRLEATGANIQEDAAALAAQASQIGSKTPAPKSEMDAAFEKAEAYVKGNKKI